MQEAKSELGSTGLVEQVAGIGRELGQLAHLERLESKDRNKLIKRIRVLKSWLGKDIRLYARSFIGALDPVSMAYLDRGCNLVMVDWNGNPTSQPLDRLDPDLFMAVARDSTPLLVKAIEAKVEGRTGRLKPRLVARVQAEKAHTFLLGRRTYRLFILNSGGDTTHIRVSVHTNDSAHRYGPFDLGRDGQTELDLGRVSKVEDSHSLPIEVHCKAADSRRYRGESKIDLKDPEWQEISLLVAQPRRRSSTNRGDSQE